MLKGNFIRCIILLHCILCQCNDVQKYFTDLNACVTFCEESMQARNFNSMEHCQRLLEEHSRILSKIMDHVRHSQLSQRSNDIVVLQGSTFSLPCVPDEAPVLSQSTYTWSFTSAQTQQTLTLNKTENILHFGNINTKDSGQYKCVQEGHKEENRVRLSRTFNIRVEAPPPLQEWRVFKVEAGSNALLPCNFDQSWPLGETESAPVVWKRETKEGLVILKPENPPGKQEKKDKTPQSQRVFWDSRSEQQDIKIINTTYEDAGMYQCVTTNQTLLVELEVQAPPLPRCFGHTAPWENCLDSDSRSGGAILQESLLEFSASVYSELKGTKAQTNLIFSPLSIAAAFYNLLLGARGETRKQLEEALRLPPEFSCLHSEVKKLKRVLMDTLGMASGIFYNPELQLSEAFINQSLEFYDAVPQMLTYDETQNVDLINKWVAEKTNNRITELNSEVDPGISFVLLNAVYFHGKWKTLFESTNKMEQFSTFSGSDIEIQTLYSSKYNLQMGYNNDLKAEVGRFPLTGKNSLYILMPNVPSEKAFILMENNLNYKTMLNMVSEISKTPIQSAEVTLPKIKLTLTTKLEEMLRKMGLSGLFSEPNLCGIFPDESASFISDVRHRAFLSLTEKGVEAAAATSISFSRSHSSFSVLQPFVLILWNDEAKAPLFMGRIINPEK